MLNVNLLKAEMVLKDVSVKDLAEKQGWSLTTAYRKLNGSVPFMVPEIETCKDTLSLTAEQTMAIFFDEKIS